MRVLVCDDSAVMRKVLTRLIQSEPGFVVIDTARNGRDAVEKTRLLKPDAVTLDIEMPELDGLSALKQIMDECPTPVLMCSSLTTEGSHAALRALEAGAVDFLAKDAAQLSAGDSDLRDELLRKLRGLRESKPTKPRRRLGVPASASLAGVGAAKASGGGGAGALPTFRPGQFDAVLLGSSTGGPPVLEAIFTSLPASLCVPIVVAQHMPLLFTKSMSERLGQMCNVRVAHGEDGVLLQRGTVYITPGGSHGRVRRVGASLRLEVGPEPATALYKPSVDELLFSGARVLGSRCLAVVVTGMGEDGLQGGRELVNRGGTIIAQDQETACIWGMPRAVTEAGLVAANLNPAQIGAALAQLSGSAAAA